MPRRLRNILIGAVAILVPLSLLPPLLVAMARVTRSGSPRLHLVPDMDNQPKLKAQARNALFADRRAMRPVIPGTVAVHCLQDDDALYRGRTGGQWVQTFPVSVTTALMRRGRERFDVFCATCHGLVGAGNGAVSLRAEQLQEGTWTPPASYHTDLVRNREVGHLFNTITHGIRNMAAYGPQIPTEDRWAIVAYVRALQRSQNARLDDVPPAYRPTLR